MEISFTFRAKVLKSFSLDEVVSDAVNNKVIEHFSTFEVDIAEFLSNEVKILGVSGGRVLFEKLNSEGHLGFVAELNIEQKLTDSEVELVSGQMTNLMDEEYFGPDGLFCDIENGGYYVLPVHPEFNKSPVSVVQQ